ncbi:MAG: hypothetical protein R3F43_29745 [bacterium]
MRGPWLAGAHRRGCDAGDPPADRGGAWDVAPGRDMETARDAAPADAGGQDLGFDAAPLDATPPDASPPDAAVGAEPCPRGPEGRCDAVGWITSRVAYPALVDHHTTLIALDGERHGSTIGGIESDELGGAVRVYADVRRRGRGARRRRPPSRTPALPRPTAFHAQIRVGDRSSHRWHHPGRRGVGAVTDGLAGRVADGRVGDWQRFAVPPGGARPPDGGGPG